MGGKRKPAAPTPTPPAAQRASERLTGNERDEHVVNIDLERLSTADVSLELDTVNDVESQTQQAAAGAGKELQSSADGSSPAGGSSSSSQKAAPLMSKWRWIGQMELQYLVTNRRTPRSRPEGSASSVELGNGPDSSSSAAAPSVGAGQELEKGAFVRVVTEGAGIPAALEGGSEGGRQRIAHILLPTTAESPERDPPGNPDQVPPLSVGRSGELAVVSDPAAVAAAATGGKKRKVLSVVGDQNQGLGNGKASEEAMGGGGGGGHAGEEATGNGNGYHHGEEDDDDNEPLCRVCHQSTTKTDAISLGCACKLDLGRAHKGCAETWFQVRGNRQCEICGQIAQNVQLLESMDDRPTDNPDPIVTVTVHHPATICWQNRPIRNFLLVFLVAAFLIPWLFRFAYYRS